jgi:hypothetical protein
VIGSNAVEHLVSGLCGRKPLSILLKSRYAYIVEELGGRNVLIRAQIDGKPATSVDVDMRAVKFRELQGRIILPGDKIRFRHVTKILASRHTKSIKEPECFSGIVEEINRIDGRKVYHIKLC